jgi:hypothetical protein
MNNNVVFVTAFYDIGRVNWTHLERPSMYYINALTDLITMLKHSIVVYLDDRYVTDFSNRQEIKNAIDVGKLTIIPINETWLVNNTKGWRTVPEAQLIMHSKYYTELLKERINNKQPENTYAKYNGIVHCKIDFINITKNLTNMDGLYVWIDSGYLFSVNHKYVKDDTKLILNFDKINKNKITFMLVNKIHPFDFDTTFTIVNARETHASGFYIVPSHLITPLYESYFSVIDKFNKLGISDDDQHIYLQCIALMGFDMFELVIEKEGVWPNGVRYFMC